ncbi:MAG: ribonuclease HII [Xanthomonadales bacterium]|nr:ribonuclease HII [Xanthomonadales bacterium]
MSGLVAGVDEAGRGPLAGPVLAAAVILDPARPIPGLGDSKTIPPARRARLAARIRAEALAYALAAAEAEEIDRLGILEATFRAMRRALAALVPRPGLARIDGPLLPPELPCAAEAIVRGDARDPAIGAASILAKVERDRRMAELDRRYPGYGFARHKGYPTALHLERLARLGPCPEHRLSFAPVARLRSAIAP